MKNKNIIILIIVIISALLILGYSYLNKQDEITVKLLYVGDSLEYDMEANSYKYNEIELTSEQQKEIVKLYKKTNIEKKQNVKEAFLGTIKLEFNDGNVITMDNNNSNYAYNGEYCIRLSKGFKKYILSILTK